MTERGEGLNSTGTGPARLASVAEAATVRLGGGTVWGKSVAGETAKGATETLTDDEPPAGAAFYRVVVSAW